MDSIERKGDKIRGLEWEVTTEGSEREFGEGAYEVKKGE